MKVESIFPELPETHGVTIYLDITCNIWFNNIIALIYGSFLINYQENISSKSINFNSLIVLFKYSFPFLFNSISWWIVGLSDRWIITYNLGVEYNAVYAVANKIPNLFNIIYNNFNLAWQDSASMATDNDDIDTYYSTVFNSLFEFLIQGMLLLIVVSPVVFYFFIDSSYNAALYQMPILFISVFFHSLGAFYGGNYVGLKESKKLGYSSILGAVINILFNFLFINQLGLFAASISTLIAY